MQNDNTSQTKLRIAICGSASVGKTSLVNALAYELRLPGLREEMRDYLQRTGADFSLMPPAEVETVLLELWHERKQKEQEAESFIADNCPLDFAAYALYYGCMSTRSMDLMLSNAAGHLASYDAIFLLPWGVLPYEQDGVRPIDPYLQLRYQFLLEGLLRRYVHSDKLHFVPQTLLRIEDRQRWLTARLEQRPALVMGRPASHRQGKGRVYLVGAGPGDPKLLTLRAFELLQQADVVAYDLLVSPELLALIPARAELLAVGRRNGMRTLDYRLHPDVIARALDGKTVVRLKAGDPLLFGRGGEEAEELSEAGIPFEIVPGITAALGAASYAGIPLTHRSLASQVLLGPGHEMAPRGLNVSSVVSEDLSHRTTVLYMVARRLQSNLERLQAEGYHPETPAALVASATTPRQQVIVGTLATLAQRAPVFPAEVPAILVVGHVVSLRTNVHWFQSGQLSQRRILVARARPGVSHISRSLRMLGAEVVETPVITSLPLDDRTALNAKLAQHSFFDAVVFSCQPGVEAAADWLAGCSRSAICIGEQAGRAMQSLGVTPANVLPGSCREALEEQAGLFATRRLLVVTSNEGRPQLARELFHLGAQVECIAAYQVERHFEREASVFGLIDAVVLPSSTAAHHLLSHESAASLRHLPMVAIGPHTQAAAVQCGAANVVCAPHDDVDAVVSSVLQLLTNRNSAREALRPAMQVGI